MARAQLAITQLSVSAPILNGAGSAPNGAGVGNGNYVNTQSAKNVILIVDNKSGTGARTVTVVNAASAKEQGVVQPSQSIVVAQSKIGYIHLGGIDYVDSSGNVNFDIDGLDSGNVVWMAVQLAVNFQ